MAEQTPDYDVHRPYEDSRGTWCVSDDMAWPCEVASAHAAGLAAGAVDALRDMADRIDRGPTFPLPEPPEPCPLEHVCDDEGPCGCWCDLHDVRMDECPTFRLVSAWLADAERRGRTAAADLEARVRELTVSTDGDPINYDAEIPVGEVVRVLAEWRAARVAENGADR